MPDTNVAVVRRVLDAFGRRDIGAFLANADPEISFFAPTAVYAGHGGQLYRGHDYPHFHDVARVWDELQIDAREYLEADKGCVAVIGSVAGRLKNGESISSAAGWAFRVDEGKIVWCRAYTDPSDAPSDVGLGK